MKIVLQKSKLSNPNWENRLFQKLFTISRDRKRALVFPAVNASSRLCLNSLLDDVYPDLTTFSVGDDNNPRTVVCRQSAVASQTLKDVSINIPRNGKVVSEKNVLSKSKNNENCEKSLQTTKQRKRPDRAVYVPPPCSNRRPSPGQQQSKQSPVKKLFHKSNSQI
jgi:hypothetical protein